MEINFYLNPLSQESYESLAELQVVFEKFEKRVNFTPYYAFKDLEDIYSEAVLRQMCYYQGVYCVVEDSPFSFIQVLNEGIRQKCIWTENQDKYLWWNYIDSYRLCLQDRMKQGKDLNCYSEISNKLNFPPEFKQQVDNCLDNSFENPQDYFGSDNKVLQKDASQYPRNLVYTIPLVILNKNLLRESLRREIILSAICEKIIDPPEVCVNPQNIKLVQTNPEKSALKWILIILAIGMTVALIVVVVVKMAMGKQIDAEVNKEIEEHVSEYMKLRDSQITETND